MIINKQLLPVCFILSNIICIKVNRDEWACYSFAINLIFLCFVILKRMFQQMVFLRNYKTTENYVD